MFKRKKEEEKQIALQAFYNIEANLLQNLGSFDNVIAFTSTSNHTDQMQNLYVMARHIAEDGPRILLIDTNLRSPQIENIVGRGKERGFIDGLLGDYSHESIIESDEYEKNLTLMTTGKVSDYADKFLEVNDIRNYYDDLRGRYDYVFISTSEIIGIPEASLFSALADKCVVFTSYANLNNEVYDQSIELLEKASTDILGIIVTNYVFKETEVDELFGDK